MRENTKDENIEKKSVNAFRSNVIYFEMMRQHNLKLGLEDVNIETDVKALISSNLNGNVLDAGCGEGSISIWMAKKNLDALVFGVDISPIGIKMAKKLADRLEVENTCFLVGDIRKLPFPDNTFDSMSICFRTCNWSLKCIERISSNTEE